MPDGRYLKELTFQRMMRAIGSDTGRSRVTPPPDRRRRTPPSGKGGTTSNVKILIVLIDDDIIVPDDMEDPYEPLEDEMNPWAYFRNTVSLKYYEEVSPSEYDVGHDSDTKMKLVLTSGSSDSAPEYATVTIFYDDGDDFKVGKYTRADYPDYDPEAPWPPPDVTDPDVFFKRRFRGITINGVLVTILCKMLPAPPLPPPSS